MKAVTIPLLPCADIGEAVSFYEALGFRRTYGQVKPNPYAVVELGEIGIHLFGIDGFDPAESYGSTVILVDDPDTLYADFAAGFKARFGKLVVTGIPRILRPRKRQGTVRGFTVVDPGGNWLRIAKLGSSEEGEAEQSTGLPRVVLNAARLADAHGDDASALRLLQNGLVRFPEAEALERVRALLYLSELLIRTGHREDAENALAQVLETDLSADDLRSVSAELDHIRELVSLTGDE